MKFYPSITKDIRQDIYIYAFDKLDGSNMRAEWNSKKGFYKFGTRNQLTDENTMPFGKGITLFKEKYEKDLTEVFNKQKWKDAICFFEYYGPSSFAGTHNYSETMNAVLFDVAPYKQGILSPKDFINYFGHLDIPKVLYEGYVTKELFDNVKQSTMPGMTFEGVVCKGANDKKTKMPIMFKIKSKAWLSRLKEFCKDNQSLFDQLA